MPASSVIAWVETLKVIIINITVLSPRDPFVIVFFFRKIYSEFKKGLLRTQPFSSLTYFLNDVLIGPTIMAPWLSP